MPAFYLALIAALVATLAGRETVRVARLSDGLGAGVPLLAVVWVASIASSAFAGWIGSALADQLNPAGKAMLVALALGLAAIELLVLRPPKAPREPTRSAGAVLLVLLAAQSTDAARLIVMALAASTGAPWLAGAGGAIGSGIGLTVAVLAGSELEARLPLGVLRGTVAGLLVVAALVTGLGARGLIG